MARMIHFGIHHGAEHVEGRILPGAMTTDGDSFLVWGEKPQPNEPLHILLRFEHEPTSGAVRLLREQLEGTIAHPAERLADYVVSTDADDWSEDVRVFLLDGTDHTVLPGYHVAR